MNKNIVLFAAVTLSAISAGCASRGSKEAPPAPVSSTPADSGISTSGAGNGALGNGSQIPSSTATAGAAYSLTDKTVYFSLDGSDIDSAGQAVVTNFGKYLTSAPGAKVRLEGNTDERGSAEYNMALGERRAQSVARALKASGVTDAQLSIISYGEERPAANGHDESAWSKNRRVDIVQQ